MTMKRVYLDQRDWITLAREHYGVTSDPAIADVLAMVREAASHGHASFPLSSGHYIETYRHGDPGRRQRLGRFMAEVSRFHTIAPAPSLLRDEVHVAVHDIVGLAPVRCPTPFGRGHAHAFGRQATYLADDEPVKRAVAQYGVEATFDYFETAMIAGPDDRLPVDGIALPSLEFAQRQVDFEEETARRLSEWGHTSDRAHRLVLTQESPDALDYLVEESSSLGIDPRSVFHSEPSATAFMLALPAKGTVCRLRMTAHEDQQFRWHVHDLTDITALGTAAAYCDIVVAEKRWGSILRRHARHTRATVTSNLRDLPRLLLQ